MPQLLLQLGADLQARDYQGNTTLHYALGWGRLRIGKILIRRATNSILLKVVVIFSLPVQDWPRLTSTLLRQNDGGLMAAEAWLRLMSQRLLLEQAGQQCDCDDKHEDEEDEDDQGSDITAWSPAITRINSCNSISAMLLSAEMDKGVGLRRSSTWTSIVTSASSSSMTTLLIGY